MIDFKFNVKATSFASILAVIGGMVMIFHHTLWGFLVILLAILVFIVPQVEF